MNSNNKMACMQAMMACHGQFSEQIDISLVGLSDDQIRDLAANAAETEMLSRWPDRVVTRSEKRYHEYTSRWTGESERSNRYTTVQVPVEGEWDRQVPYFQERYLKEFLAKRDAGEKVLVARAAAGTHEDAVIRVLSEIKATDETSFGEVRGIFASYSVTVTPRFDEVEQFIVEGCSDSLLELRQLQMPVAELVKFFLFPENKEKYKKKVFGLLDWEY